MMFQESLFLLLILFLMTELYTDQRSLLVLHRGKSPVSVHPTTIGMYMCNEPIGLGVGWLKSFT